jgi:cytochrome c biogenesis protein CcmG/thiol:disulfide interchange protein DsbE
MNAPAGWARRPVIVAIAVAVAAMTLGGCGTGGSARVGPVGHPVPDIAAPAIGGGNFSLQALRGRWVVVNFFATWCDPCKNEYPDLVRFAGQHQGTVQVVGVVYEDRSADALHFHRAEGGTWPIVADPSARIAGRYLVSALPQSFVIDRRGDLVAHIFGGVTVAKLDQALAGKPE